jgi:glycosyltransferase involved in cell wall biosynthesis
MINIYAPINNLGYGIHANNMIKALYEAGEDMNLSTIGQVQSDPYFEPFWKPAAENLINFDSKAPSLFIFHDEHSNRSCGSPNLVFSVFETTKLKLLSQKMLNNGPADIVLTTTKEHKELLSTQIDKPIHVVNEGVDDSIFNTIPVDPYIDTGKFTYVTVGKQEERKNTDMIIKEFLTTMKDKEVALICHSFNMFLHTDQKEHPFTNLSCWTGINPISHNFEYKGFDGKAHKFTYDKCDIYFTAPVIPTPQMGSLYHSANVGIQISRAEGWDLPLTEMLATGMPVIASKCIGHNEYLDSAPEDQQRLNVALDGLEEAKDNMWFKDGGVGAWGKVNPVDLREKLITTFDNQEIYTGKNDIIADYMSENFSWKKSVVKLMEIINAAK